MQTYWYVYKRWGGPPRHQHLSYEDAVREAQRLIDTVGGEFEILQAVSVVKAAPKYVIEAYSPISVVAAALSTPYNDDNIPF
jgi:hypothetical protein